MSNVESLRERGMQKGFAHILLARNLASAFLAPYLFLLLQMGTDLLVSVTHLVLVVIIISRYICVFPL